MPKWTKFKVEMPPKLHFIDKPSSQHFWTGLGQFVAPLLLSKQTNSDKKSCSFRQPKPMMLEHTNADILTHTTYDDLQVSLDFYSIFVQIALCKHASTPDKRCSRLFQLRLATCFKISHNRYGQLLNVILKSPLLIGSQLSPKLVQNQSEIYLFYIKHKRATKTRHNCI